MQEQKSTLKDFQTIRKLGEGAFGQVYQVKRKQDKQTYALKKVRMTGMKDKEKDNAINQIRILASLNDQYIIKFKDAFYDESGYLCIVMEFAAGGDLMKQINNHLKTRCRIKQSLIWKALHDIAKGLKSLHDKKILHRDLKAANIFIGADGKYKLGDLNVSKVLKKGLAHTQTGTPYYASPQVWKDLPYDSKSDIWSFGCVIYQMAALSPPFKATDLQGLYKKVKTGVFPPIPSSYSQELSQVINSLIKLDPKVRPSADQLLKNAYLRKNVGLSYDQNSYISSDPLLNTIKFNHQNLKSLKNNLPKAAYQSPMITAREKSRRSSIQNIQRDRALSACGNRNLSPTIFKKQIQKQKVNYSINQPVNHINEIQRNYMLPPRPNQRRPSQQREQKDPRSRLMRIGEEIMGTNKYERCYSQNK